MSKLQLNSDGTVKTYTLILARTNHEHLGQINNVSGIVCKANMNSSDELSFTVHKIMAGRREPLWEDIRDLRLIYVKEWDEYFQIKVPLSEATDTTKSIIGTSQCEAELGQTLISLEINSEDDIARSNYDENFPTVFYRNPADISKYNHLWNKNISRYTIYNADNTVNEMETARLREHILKNSSLMHRMLYKNPNYSIGHIDESLMDVECSFSVSDTSLYDFMSDEASEQFGCLFRFDSVNREISAYDLYTVCLNDGCPYLSRPSNTNRLRYRGSFHDKCPICGSTHLKYYGEDTAIFVSVENLTDEIKYETNADSVKNTFKLEAGDDLMTAQVANCNPGGNYIVNIAPETKNDMSPDLQDRLDEYTNAMEAIENEYQEYVTGWQQANEQIDYLTHTMMPSVSDIENGTATISSSTEAAKITQDNLSPMAVSSLTKSTSSYTISSALENYVKVFVKTGYVKVKAFDYSFNYIASEGSDAIHKGIWKGKFRVTNYSDEEDVTETGELTIEINDDYQTFISQKIVKNIAGQADDDHSVFDVLSISDLKKFKDALKLYSLERLRSFHDAIEAACNVLIEFGQADEGSEMYSDVYQPYLLQMNACSAEMDTRTTEIGIQQAICNDNLGKIELIRSELNFADFLGEDLYKEFCSFRREDKYSNQNYVSDGMTTAETIASAKKFLEQAKREIITYSTPQHSISSSLYNLLLIPAFKPLIDKFQLGNWIRFKVDDKIYRLRLIGYEINFDNISNINVEFSTATQTADGYNDIQSILSQAASTATTISMVTKQAEKGAAANKQITDVLKEGLNSALINIRSNDNEETIIDNNGIHLRTYDDTTGEYALEQGLITHNLFVYSDDGFKTAKTALGKHNYCSYDSNSSQFVWKEGYGLSADFLTAPHIYSGEIIGGDIYSTNYSSAADSSATGTHINLNTGSFSLAGGRLAYDSDKNKMTLKEVVIDWDSSSVPEIKDIRGLEDFQNKVNTALTGSATTEISTDYVISPKIAAQYLYVTNDDYSVEIDPNHSAGTNTLEDWLFAIRKKNRKGDGSVIMGVDTHGKGYFNGEVNATSGIFNGEVNATSGKIGDCSIENGILAIKNVNIGEKLSGNVMDTSAISIGNLDFDIQPNILLYTNEYTDLGTSSYPYPYIYKTENVQVELRKLYEVLGNNRGALKWIMPPIDVIEYGLYVTNLGHTGVNFSDDNGWSYISFSLNKNQTKKSTYTISCYVMNEPTTSTAPPFVNFKFSLDGMTESDTLTHEGPGVWSSENFRYTGSNWERISYTFQADGVTSARFYFRFESNFCKKLWMCGFKLEESSETTEYTDSTTKETGWKIDANNISHIVDGEEVLKITDNMINSIHFEDEITDMTGLGHTNRVYSSYSSKRMALGGELSYSYLGTSEHPWDYIYCTNGVTQVSDKKHKKDITNLNDSLTKKFVMGLSPCSYKLNYAAFDRTHYGLIAQDVESLLSELGLSIMDFGGLCKDEINGRYEYGLRYEEFIAPLIKAVQMQQQEIDELKELIKCKQEEI